jgi:hypothetical protein
VYNMPFSSQCTEYSVLITEQVTNRGRDQWPPHPKSKEIGKKLQMKLQRAEAHPEREMRFPRFK